MWTNGEGRLACLVVVLGWGLQTWAIWSQDYPPLVDLPNHMARHYLEARQLAGQEVPPPYVIQYRILPNLGADLVLPLLMQLLPPMPACKVFLTLSVLLYWLGPALFIFQQACSTPAAWVASLLLLPLSFSSAFFWGFLNFYSGFGLCFLVLCHYLWLLQQPTPRPLHLLLHALLVPLLFLWHLSVWGIYGVLMGCRLAAEVAWTVRAKGLRACLRPVLISVLPVLPSLGLFAFYLHNLSGGIDPNAGVTWGTWSLKLQKIGILFRAYDLRFDLAALLPWLAAVVVSFGGALLRDRPASWLLLAMAALVGLYLLIPFQLGTTSDTDSRLLPALLVCMLAWLALLPAAHFRLAMSLIVLSLVIRQAGIQYAWDRLAEHLQPHVQALEVLPSSSRVLPVLASPARSKDYPTEHFPAWAVIERGCFVPILFADPGQHALRQPAPIFPEKELKSPQLRDHYDLLWIDNPEGQAVRIPDGFQRVFDKGPLTLWRAGRPQ